MVNDAFVVLLPKKQDVMVIKDYRPIVLIHTVGKLISKVLENRLAPKLGNMVHPIQSALSKAALSKTIFAVFKLPLDFFMSGGRHRCW
jgi:hypothetical protein